MDTETTLEQEILAVVRQMNADQKRYFLDLLRSVQPSRPRGMSGPEFVAHVRSLHFPPQDLAEMAAAIEEI
jgi:hypothetical protein